MTFLAEHSAAVVAAGVCVMAAASAVRAAVAVARYVREREFYP